MTYSVGSLFMPIPDFKEELLKFSYIQPLKSALSFEIGMNRKHNLAE